MKKNYRYHFLALLAGVSVSTTSLAKESEKNNRGANAPLVELPTAVKGGSGSITASLNNNASKAFSFSVIYAIVVNGKVTDENGEGLPGVTVRLKSNPGTGTVTDLEGNYRLSVPDEVENPTLIFSFVGYLNEEVQVGNRSTIDVNLTPDIKSLDEVVVVGYGTQKKSDVTGAVTSISAEEFNEGVLASPEQLITGKVAGVQVTPSGAPGGGSRIRIRGGTSLNASNDPLIVVDGVPLSGADVAGSGDPLSFINPDDIASFDILKDASATAIYGSRASNGVIIITTKKGKAGQKFSVNFKTQHSISTLPKTVDVLSAGDFRTIVEERAPESQQALLGSDTTDWQSQIFRQAYSTDNNLTISGAVKAFPYRLSLGYLNQDGILETSHFDRKSAALALNPTFLDDHLKVNLNVRGVMTQNRFADEAAIGSAISFDPTQPVYVAENPFGGYFEWVDPQSGTPNTRANRNPVSMLQQRRDESEVFRSIGNLSLDYKFHFLPELRANLVLGYDVIESAGSVNQPKSLAAVYNQGGSFNDYEESTTNTLLDFYLNYSKELGALGKVELIAGYSYQDFFTDIPSFPTYDEQGDVFAPAGRHTRELSRLKSYFGRAFYSFKDRYLLTATIRQDGSSRFSSETRWGTFPALALAWRINEEAFLKDSDLFSDLKLRAGWGITGQQNLNDDFFPYISLYSPSDARAQYQFGNTFYNTLRPSGYDPGIKWEETVTYNFGIDYGFLQNRITGSVEYYFKETKDLLAEIAYPAGSNLTNELPTNVGSIENRGVEASVNIIAVDNGNFRWEAGLNGTYNKNEITNLSRVAGGQEVNYPIGDIAGGTGNRIQVQTAGYPRASYYVYQQVYNVEGNPVEGLYVDRTGDGVINEQDMYRFKSPDPTYFLGFSSRMNYKNWNLNFVLRGNINSYVYNNIAANAYYSNIYTWPGYLLNSPARVLETNFVGGDDPNRLLSDLWLENSSFLRMDNISLGYNFGNMLSERLKLGLSATVQNAFVLTNYSGLDPEIESGIDNEFYPLPRTFTLGLNIGF